MSLSLHIQGPLMKQDVVRDIFEKYGPVLQLYKVSDHDFIIVYCYVSHAADAYIALHSYKHHSKSIFKLKGDFNTIVSLLESYKDIMTKHIIKRKTTNHSKL